jgi:integrase
MGRKATPWWWEARKAYYATIKGVRHRLGTVLRQAESKLKRLEGEPREQAVPSDSVALILDAFIDWTEENRAAKTARGYKDFCQSFIDYCGKMPVSKLKREHVEKWLTSRKTWNSTTKRNAITALQRGLNWAVNNLDLERNPIHGMEKPEAKKRTSVVTLGEFKAILRHTSDRAFRWLLEFCWDVGTRPQEVKGLEARHVDLEKRRCILPADEAKGKRASPLAGRVCWRCPAGRALGHRRRYGERTDGFSQAHMGHYVGL